MFSKLIRRLNRLNFSEKIATEINSEDVKNGDIVYISIKNNLIKLQYDGSKYKVLESELEDFKKNDLYSIEQLNENKLYLEPLYIDNNNAYVTTTKVNWTSNKKINETTKATLLKLINELSTQYDKYKMSWLDDIKEEYEENGYEMSITMERIMKYSDYTYLSFDVSLNGKSFQINLTIGCTKIKDTDNSSDYCEISDSLTDIVSKNKEIMTNIKWLLAGDDYFAIEGELN